jgi:hypothetical protein
MNEIFHFHLIHLTSTLAASRDAHPSRVQALT